MSTNETRISEIGARVTKPGIRHPTQEKHLTKGGVLITGVSTGIGAATLRELVAAGFRVFGTVRRAREMAAVQAAGATPLLLDVTVRSGVTRARETIERALGDEPLVGLVNNAGIPCVGPIELVDPDDLRRVFEVNVFGVVTVTQVFLPMLRASRGRIVNISSVSARVALPFAGPYAASKSALEAISDSLRRELLPSGVAVVVIQPGSVQSAIWSKIGFDRAGLAGTVYWKLMDRLQEIAARSGAEGLPAESVSRAVLQALTLENPPVRMLVVRKGRFSRRLLPLIPDRWLDRIIARRLDRGEA